MANGKRMRRLVISRRNRQRVYIGDSCVQVEWFPGRGNLIKMTIDAPDEILVLREELKERSNSNVERQDHKARVQAKEDRQRGQDHQEIPSELD